MSVQDFLIEANKKYVAKMHILANMIKIGYQDTEVLECRMRLADSYLEVLSKITGDYALSEEELNAVINHLIILLELRDIVPPTIEDFREVTVITETIIVIKEIIQPPMRLSFLYSIPVSGRPDVSGVVYTTEGVDDVVVTVTHNINKKNATIEVTNSSGDRVYPGIRYISNNVVSLYFNNASTAVGTITISE